MLTEDAIHSIIDYNIKICMTLQKLDLYDMLGNNKPAVKKAIEYLNKNYDYYKYNWYYKKLKTVKCAFCGKEFKTPSPRKTCSDECAERYRVRCSYDYSGGFWSPNDKEKYRTGVDDE